MGSLPRRRSSMAAGCCIPSSSVASSSRTPFVPSRAGTPAPRRRAAAGNGGIRRYCSGDPHPGRADRHFLGDCVVAPGKARVVMVRAGEDEAFVYVDTVPSHPMRVVCERRSDGLWEWVSDTSE